jgi:PDZ domain
MKRLRATIWMGFVLALSAAWTTYPGRVLAQNGVVHDGAVPAGTTNDQPLLPEDDGGVAPGVPANRTLEIAPRVVAPPPSPAAAPSPVSPNPDVDDAVSDATGTADDAAHQEDLKKELANERANLPSQNRPYLGLAAQYIVTHDPPWKTVQGLEVVSVDSGSPAELAGLKGRGQMTSVGETGATASNLMAPLNLIVMPLLKKSGSLGSSGDLIVAIDDQRVEKPDALKDALDTAKPGDTLYLTIVRAGGDSKKGTVKVPVKLTAGKGPGGNQAADASDGN